MWTVITRPSFDLWFQAQPDEAQEKILASLELLATVGPMLSRPYADTVKCSRLPNLKELRIQHRGKPLRAFYAFDSSRRAIVLCAGDKTGKKDFYPKMVTLAEKEFDLYLSENTLKEKKENEHAR